MKKITLFAFMVLAFAACKHSHEDGHDHGHHHGDGADKGVWSEVDELHDISMKSWVQFGGVEEALETVLKEAKEDKSALKGFSKEAVDNVLTQVEKANQDMMAWMENHGKTRESIAEKTDAEVDKIIETERQSVQRINDDSQKALDAANEVLKALGINLESDEHDHEGHDHDHDHDGHDH